MRLARERSFIGLDKPHTFAAKRKVQSFFDEWVVPTIGAAFEETLTEGQA
jgi:hypothetical protein